MCMVEMLAMWLTGPDEKRSKHFLQALQRLTPQPVLLPKSFTTTHSSTSVVTRHIR